MKPKFGQQFRVKWIDAFGDSQWTDEEDLKKLIDQFEKPADQTLYFIKQTDEFYIFTSGKPEAGKSYIDIHGIPRGWIERMTLIK
jgi:hypothetical protein